MTIDPRDHVGLCFLARRRYGGQLPGDALGVAYLALAAAASCYPGSSARRKGIAFSSYAVLRIRAEFHREADRIRGVVGRDRRRVVRPVAAARLVPVAFDRGPSPDLAAMIAEMGGAA